MSHLVELMLTFHNWIHGVPKAKASIEKTSNPLRAGVLSAAAINWSAFFDPVESHPDIVLVAVAARDLSKAEEQISKYGLQNVRAYGSYKELLANPDIDVIYTGLPNGLHVPWAIEAMKAGKHVLCEKPIASTASEVDLLKACSIETGKVLMEAKHWKYYPAAHVVKEMVTSGKYGAMKSYRASMTVPAGNVPHDDIRFNYDLAGGTSMDCCYVVSGACYFWNSGSGVSIDMEVNKAIPRLHQTDRNIDEAMDAEFVLKGKDGSPGVQCSTHCDLSQPKLFGLIPKLWEATPSCEIEFEKARVTLDNFVGPFLRHKYTILGKNARGELNGEKETFSCYKGGPRWGDRGERWWTTYRYQLEAFVDLVRGGDATAHLKYLDEAKDVLTVLDAIYEKAGLPLRKSVVLE